ncbi:MAG: DUF1501 domain-containing protein [Planctomycetota bacterium]|nr:DUF1501 domain-containing protein [Planctomycetaceae bacterium]MDQ3329054.1 DUF1501 domain-containing protein [Planctomycetota bacterium]
MHRLIQSAFTGNRRSWMFSAAGAGLSFLLPPLTGRAAERRGPERSKSLLTIWLQGGPSQLETWDPHPGGPTGGPTQAIKTTIPGVKIADLYPRTAEAIHPLSVIRSLVSKEGDHERGTYHLRTGYRPDPSVRHPSIGSMLVHERPAKGLELPPHVALDGGQWPPRGGFLGDEYDAFRVGNPGGSIANATSSLSEDRQKRRLEGLNVLERGFAVGRPTAERKTLHRKATDDALALMTSDQLKAFEIEDEPADVKAAYGDDRFGKSCLVARRLIETGVRAVEVTLDGFDSHTNNFEVHRDKATILDPALAALLKDLESRDLLASTVVLVLGEFGRTPKINPFDGRDHWPNGFPCLLGGGGLASGRVIGATDPAGVKDPERPVPVADLFATILAALDLDPTKELMSPIGRPLKLSEGLPVNELLPS